MATFTRTEIEADLKRLGELAQAMEPIEQLAQAALERDHLKLRSLVQDFVHAMDENLRLKLSHHKRTAIHPSARQDESPGQMVAVAHDDSSHRRMMFRGAWQFATLADVRLLQPKCGAD